MIRYTILTLTLSVLPFSAHAAPLAPKPASTQPAAKVNKAQAAARVIQARAFVNNIKQQRENQRQAFKNMPDGGTFKFDDLVHFSIVEGTIKAEWKGNIPQGQVKKIKIEGSSASWQVTRITNTPGGYFNLVCYDFDAPLDGFWMYQIFSQETANVLQFSAQGNEANDIYQLSYVQQPGNIRFTIYSIENNQYRMTLNASAADLTQLRNEHPEEVCRHLIPILRKVTGQPLLRPGAGDVYRAFTAIPADPKVTDKIVDLLPGLTSIDPIERDQATKSLRTLGPAGALAVLRFNPDLLLPEQYNRLNALVTLHSRVIVDDPAQSLKDTDFLLDCFEDEDLAVRAAAKGAIETLFGHSIDFNPAAPPAKRAAFADAIRQRLSQITATRRYLENEDLP